MDGFAGRVGHRRLFDPVTVMGVDSVRQALGADRAAVTTVVAAAFAHDPAWAFLLAEDYDRLAPLFAGALFDLRVGSGHVWVGGADRATVAMWDPPGATEDSTAEASQMWVVYRHLAGDAAWQRLTEYERAIDSVRPSTPYWYLGVLATRPDRQGRGLASTVMDAVLQRADTDGVDCCLETSTVENKEFYERRGFTDATDVRIDSGPPTWWLRRAPQGA
jgi:GNAT superfamily N-acetyltransferase